MQCLDCYFKGQMYLQASQSTCSRRRVGAVLVRDGEIIAAGWNNNLPGHLDCYLGGCPRCSDPSIPSGQHLERCICVHAEQNVLAYCAKHAIPTEGSTIYLPATSCLDCWKMVVLSGIVEEVIDSEYPGAHQAVMESAELCGVKVRRFECSCER